MKFYSKPILEHPEVPVADEGRFEELVSNWDNKRTTENRSENNNCYVVSLGEGDLSGQLAEILSLVQTQGDHIVGHETVNLLYPNPKTLIGKGKAQEISDRAIEAGANLLVIDAELSPSQMRNLEDITGISVCDREAIILNVFSKHAKTKRSKIQVEIAHLEYLRPRIRGLGLDMDQQASSVVTGRGPGETASAMLARKLDGRLLELKKALSRIKKTDSTQRTGRKKSKQITLVGYTNAGKTSLMNALTKAALSAKDKPFETLDTTTRCLSDYGGDVLLSDTVGFIRRLPESLLSSFESTLDGIKDASLIVMVVDASDSEKELHIETTQKLLNKIGADKIPCLYVFNKIDLLTSDIPGSNIERLSDGHKFLKASSEDSVSVKNLREKLLSEVHSEHLKCKLLVPYKAREVFKLIYSKCRVLETEAKEDGLLFSLEGEPHIVTNIRERIKEVQND
ncbi:MAG: GTPase HflX [Desulfobacterales bacterium]|nr:GTPase HflX [Desulfobacterales bacterium]MCP4160895.1 GTPase HflX [Deltaproteobacteria bacterium]